LKYKTYLEELLQTAPIDKILMWIVMYPVNSKNLFSIVSQRWYCKIGVIRDLIVEKNRELFEILYKSLQEKYAFSPEKVILLQSLLNDLSKKYCIFDCKETLDITKLVPEIKKLFF
jgi:hypothetical protein